MIRLFIILLLAGCPLTGNLLTISAQPAMSNQPTDSVLRDAYLSQDLTIWGEYLKQSRWELANHAERSRILIYEYGYVPYLQSIGDTVGCLHHYALFEQHIADAQTFLSAAEYAAYRSAAYAYHLMSGKGGPKDAFQSLHYAKKAIQVDPLNPIALYSRANVYFHAPSIAGGSKKKALEYYQKAEQVMEQEDTYRHLWIYPATLLTEAQCLDKMGRKKEAKELCYKILRLYPSFVYVRNEYLPTLLEP